MAAVCYFSKPLCGQAVVNETGKATQKNPLIINFSAFEEREKKVAMICDQTPFVRSPTQCKLTFFQRLPLECDCSEWCWVKPLNKVGVQREKPISPALSETLREQDRLMRMNGRPPAH